MDSIVDIACALGEHGYYVFPVTRNKTPFAKPGHNAAVCDPKGIQELFKDKHQAGIGINCGLSNLCVLDVDCKNGKPGFENLHALQWEHGDLPPTVTALTPSGGKHFYFRGAIGVNNADIPRLGLDIRSTGGYVVVPPSMTYTGQYTWEESLLHTDPAPLPAWLRDEIFACKQQVGNQEPQSHRNDYLTKAAGRLQEEGATPEVVLDELRRINAAEFPEPLSDEEVQKVAQSSERWRGLDKSVYGPTFNNEELERVLRALQDGQINLHSNPYVCELLRETGKDPRVRMDINARLRRSRDVREMWAVLDHTDNLSEPFFMEEEDMDIAEPERLIEGLMPLGGFGLLYAKPGVGKSTLARTLIEAVLHGGHFLGRKVLKPGPVVYYPLEELKSQVKLCLRRLGIQPGDPLLMRTGGGNAQTFLCRLKDDIRRMQPTLIVVDPLIHMLGMTNVNDYGVIYGGVNAIVQVVRESGAFMLALHHSTKNSKDSLSLESALGSTGIIGSLDTAIGMAVEGEFPDEKRFIAVTKKRFDTDEIIPKTQLVLNLVTRRLELDTVAYNHSKVLNALATIGEPASKTSVAKSIGGKSEYAYKFISAALDAGVIRLDDKGRCITTSQNGV